MSRTLEPPNPFLGTDLALDADNNLIIENGDFALVTGVDCLVANLIDRLRCSPGALLHHPDFGGGLQDHVGTTPSPDDLLQLAAEAKAQVLEEPRVAEVLSIEVCRVASVSGVWVVPESETQPGPNEPWLTGAWDSAGALGLQISIKTVTGRTLNNLVFPFAWEEPES